MIPADKLSHLLVGYALGTSALIIGWYALVLVVAVGAGKEVYDKVSGKGTPEYLDFVATVVGGLAAILFMVLA